MTNNFTYSESSHFGKALLAVLENRRFREEALNSFREIQQNLQYKGQSSPFFVYQNESVFTIEKNFFQFYLYPIYEKIDNTIKFEFIFSGLMDKILEHYSIRLDEESLDYVRGHKIKIKTTVLFHKNGDRVFSIGEEKKYNIRYSMLISGTTEDEEGESSIVELINSPSFTNSKKFFELLLYYMCTSVLYTISSFFFEFIEELSKMHKLFVCSEEHMIMFRDLYYHFRDSYIKNETNSTETVAIQDCLPLYPLSITLSTKYNITQEIKNHTGNLKSVKAEFIFTFNKNITKNLLLDTETNYVTGLYDDFSDASVSVIINCLFDTQEKTYKRKSSQLKERVVNLKKAKLLQGPQLRKTGNFVKYFYITNYYFGEDKQYKSFNNLDDYKYLGDSISKYILSFFNSKFKIQEMNVDVTPDSSIIDMFTKIIIEKLNEAI